MTLTFIVIHLMPGDVIMSFAYDIVQTYGVTYEEAYRIATAFYTGYDPTKPLHERYIEYIKRLLLEGNLGYSHLWRLPANAVIARALPWTIFVLSQALLISFAIGATLGMYIAWKRKGTLEAITMGYVSLTEATPNFATALIFLIVFAVILKLFPLRGAYSVEPGLTITFIADCYYHAALPIIVYVIEHLGMWTLLMRGSAVSVLGEDYVYAAHARGLKDKRIAITYVGRNAILPPITTLAIAFGTMLGGSLLIESVFMYPGIGYFIADAINKRDYGLMQGLFFVTTVGIVLANLITDFIYPVLDPRVRRR